MNQHWHNEYNMIWKYSTVSQLIKGTIPSNYKWTEATTYPYLRIIIYLVVRASSCRHQVFPSSFGRHVRKSIKAELQNISKTQLAMPICPEEISCTFFQSDRRQGKVEKFSLSLLQALFKIEISHILIFPSHCHYYS